MGKIILCRAREAKQPLVVKDIGLKIYTLEELCYFIYNNIYFISIDFFDDDFNSFVEETGQKQLVQIIADLKSRNAGLAQIVVSVLKYVDYYSNEEIEQLSGVLGTLDSRNVYERLKARADTLLENKCYYGAVQNYAKIIEGTYDKSLSGLFYARVYHNMGVAHARMFLYKQSVPYFEEAYKIGQHEESLKCLMAAKRLAMGNNIIESDDASDQEAALKSELENWQTMQDILIHTDIYSRLKSLKRRLILRSIMMHLPVCLMTGRNSILSTNHRMGYIWDF